MNSEQVSLASASLRLAPGSVSFSGIMAGLLFGIIGFSAFLWGRKAGRPAAIVIGVVLMGYSYFVPGPVLTWLVGAALTAALFFFR